MRGAGAVPPQGGGAVAVAVLGVAIAASFVGALPAPFELDDHVCIRANASIRSLWPLGGVLFYPHEEGRPVDGRPFLNLTLALNRALLGTSPAAFRGVNILLHWLAAALLFDVVRRVLSLPSVPTWLRDWCIPVAFTASLIWAVHPVQTAAVTYVIQRSEVLGALFILTGLDLAIAGLAGGPGWLLLGLGVVAALGGAAKETIVSLPLVTLLVDRATIASSWAGVARHWKWHAAAAAGWPTVIVMLTAWGGRGSSAGFGSASPWLYLLRQAEILWTYLLRVTWPATLVFDYGERLGSGIAEGWPWLLMTAAAFLGVSIGYAYRPRIFLGPLLFFVLLGPTSSIVPVKTQTAGEHRLYLASAALIAPAVVGLAACIEYRRMSRWVWCAAMAAVAVLLACRTASRNLDYLSPETLWRQSLEYDGLNERAALNLAAALIEQHDDEEAARLLGRVNPAGRYRLTLLASTARLAMRRGRPDEAVAACDAYLADRPEDPEMLAARGFAHWRQGARPEAEADTEKALALDDGIAGAWNTRGNLLLDAGRADEAIGCFERSLALDDGQSAAWSYLGVALQETGRSGAARQAFDRAIECDPGDAEASYNRANLLVAAGQMHLGLADYSRALALRPDFRDAAHNRCVTLARLGRLAEARRDLELFVHLGGQPSEVLLTALGLGDRSGSAQEVVPEDAP